VKELTALETLLMHPGMRFSPALKVTLPATDATTVMVFEVRNIKSPGPNAIEAFVKPGPTVTVALLDELTVR
jgi:hypothetical protein